MISKVKKILSSKAIQAGVGYTLGTFFLKGINFISLPIFSRIMSVSDYGQYNIYAAYLVIATNIIGLGLANSVRNAIYDFEDSQYDYIANLLKMVLANLLICILVFFYFKKDANTISKFIIFILVIHAFANSVLDVISVYYSCHFEYQKYLIISAVTSVSGVILSIFLMFTSFNDRIYLGRVIGSAIPPIIIAVILFTLFTNKSNHTFKKEMWRYAYRIGLPMVIFYLSYSLLTSSDRILINKFCGSAETGLYSFVFNIGMIINVFVTSLFNAWVPWFYEKMQLKAYVEIRQRHHEFVVIMTYLIAIFILSSPELLKILAPKDYWDSISLLAPITLGIFMIFIYNFYGYVELYYKKPIYLTLGTIFAALLNIVLNCIFIPKYGYISAAYTTAVSYFTQVIIHKVLSSRLHSASLFSNKTIIMSICCTCIVSLIQLALLKFALARYLIIIILVTCVFVTLTNKHKELDL